MRRFAAALWLAALACCAGGATNSLEDRFDQASKAYEQGRFAEAAALYESVITNGAPTAAAWFNLGDAEFKRGELGRAIAAWRQAERIIPRDAALRANLHFARKKVAGDNDPRVAWHVGLVRLLTVNEWLGAASFAFITWFLVLAAAEARSLGGHFWRPRGLLIWGGLLALILVGGAVASCIDQRSLQGVLPRPAPVRFGPLEDAQTAFQLAGGTEVEITDSTAGWIQIRTSDGRSGWIKRDSCLQISK